MANRHLSNIDAGLNKLNTTKKLKTGFVNDNPSNPVTVTAGDLSDPIDTGVGKDKFNTIQITGSVSGSNADFSFVLLFSNHTTGTAPADSTFVGSDNIKPSLYKDSFAYPRVSGEQESGDDVSASNKKDRYVFSLTRSALCHRWISIGWKAWLYNIL